MKFFAGIIALYRPRFNRTLVSLLQISNYRLDKYLLAFWQTNNFNQLTVQGDARKFSFRNEALRTFLDIGGLTQLAGGILLIVLGARGDIAGGILFGVAAIISYPLVWAHLVVLPVFIFRLFGLPKELGRQIVLSILGRQIKSLRRKYDFKIVAVAGSVGKTSTKFAIAETLETKFKVAWQKGNYNDPVSVPLVFFGREMPSLLNPFAWNKVFKLNNRDIETGWKYDVVVLELGTDAPGTIEQFGKYLDVDFGVLTAVAPEHLEFFGDVDNVAREEIKLAGFCKKLLVNTDLVDEKYRASLGNYETYGFEKNDWQLENVIFKNKKYEFDLKHRGRKLFSVKVDFLSQNQLYGLVAASAVASELSMNRDEIREALSKLEPTNGRLRALKGIKGSTILDDTYNSAPDAAIAALDTLYKIKAPQKIAILGSMNELGGYSAEAHKIVGEHCDPSELAQVVTVGKEAAKYLAPAAKARGCKVKTYADPYAAGAYVKGKIKKNALVLAKGSQNGVFAEEAVKLLLKNGSDVNHLVRQSPAWLKIKGRSFGV